MSGEYKGTSGNLFWEESFSPRYQSQFIQNVVKEIGNKLNRVVLNVAPYLVGIDSRIININSWLQDGSNDVGVAAIYGVGGIGKMTLAKIIFNQNQNFDRFDGASEQSDGFVRLQRKLLSDILKRKTHKIYNVDEGITKIKTLYLVEEFFSFSMTWINSNNTTL